MSKQKRAEQRRCAVPTGSLPVLSAELLAAQWEKRADELIARASKWEDEHPLHGDEGTRGEASGYRHCANDLRRHVEASINRQPEENKTGDQFRGQSAP